MSRRQMAHLLAGLLFSVRNSLHMSISSKMTREPRYSSRRSHSLRNRASTLLSRSPRGLKIYRKK